MLQSFFLSRAPKKRISQTVLKDSFRAVFLFFCVVACAPRSFRRLISHSKRLKTSSFPTRTGRERTAIVQVAPRRLFDRESSSSSSKHHRQKNHRMTTFSKRSCCFSSRRSRARPTTPRARKTERGEGASIAFVSSVLWVLLYFSMTGFEYEASTCDDIYQ